jgi:hypothetical protein
LDSWVPLARADDERFWRLSEDSNAAVNSNLGGRKSERTPKQGLQRPRGVPRLQMGVNLARDGKHVGDTLQASQCSSENTIRLVDNVDHT